MKFQYESLYGEEFMTRLVFIEPSDHLVDPIHLRLEPVI